MKHSCTDIDQVKNKLHTQQLFSKWFSDSFIQVSTALGFLYLPSSLA